MLRLDEIKGVGNSTIEKLKKLNIMNVFELLSYFPTKYIDLGEIKPILTAEDGDLNLFFGEIISKSTISKNKTKAFNVIFKDKESLKPAHFTARFFNLPYSYNQLEIGKSYKMLTKLQKSKTGFQVVNPIFESEDCKNKLLRGLYTVYPLKGIIGQKTYKSILKNCISALNKLEKTGSFLPNFDEIDSNFENYSTNIYTQILDDMYNYLQDIHFPNTLESAKDARDNLSKLDMAITLGLHKNEISSLQNHRKVFYFCKDSGIVEYAKAVEFELSSSQNQSILDIENELSSNTYMSKIVNGDVGSGKTIVAFYASVKVAKSSKQVAFMCPTEILCYQHYKSFKKIAEYFNISSAVLTGSTPESEKVYLYNKIKNNEISVVFGTQSLISKNIEYNDLTLAVIDEQHTFGVIQRALLEQKGAKDILSLTATPIPRTLALSFFDDISISYVERRKNNTSQIKTNLVNQQKLEDMFIYLNKKANEGEQSFIVCPTIADSEGNELFSQSRLISEYSHCFNSKKIGVINGKLKSAEKNDIINKFNNKEIMILIATTVIEVGIDTDAQNIAILNADRFGLATLHQLRGRVGRRDKNGYCFLHTASINPNSLERLNALTKITNGLELAEIDMQNRGIGEIVGVKQTGSMKTPIFDLPITGETLLNAKDLYSNTICKLNFNQLLSLSNKVDNTNIDVFDFLNNISNTTLNS